MRIRYTIPPTPDQGSCVIIGKGGYGETPARNALWQYNSNRAHDGQAPVSRLPNGTRAERLRAGAPT